MRFKVHPFPLQVLSIRKILCALMIISTLISKAQKKDLERANTLFYEKRYGEAYWLYKSVYQKQKKKDSGVLLKMADCNYLNNNFEVARDYYSQYFSDTLYIGIDQFGNYANAAKKTGRVKLAAKLYQKLYENKQDADAKSNFELYRFYTDSIQTLKSYNLDSNYNCIVLDASESIDLEAQPLVYVWGFEDGVFTEGETVEHCFTKLGENKISLSVRDKKNGIVRQNDTTISVFIDSPPVIFNAPKQAKQYLAVDFDAEGTQVKNNEILEYIWDLGNNETARGKKIKYIYRNKGIYNVKLTIIAEDISTKARKLHSSCRSIEIVDIYSTPNKTFSDKLNEAK